MILRASAASRDLDLGHATISETIAEIGACEFIYPYTHRVEHKKESLAQTHLAQIAADYQMPRPTVELYLSDSMMGVLGEFFA